MLHTLLWLAVALAACDAGPAGPVPTFDDATVAPGTFTGTVNGAAWTAPAEYRVDRYLDLTGLVAETVSGPPNYYTWHLVFTYPPGGLVEGADYPSDTVPGEGRSYGGNFLELYGDGAANGFTPVNLGPGEFRVTRVDTAAGVLRAEVDMTMATIYPDSEPANSGTQLPDTIRVAGVFEIDLGASYEEGEAP